jgi:hypothetical protein
MLFIRPANPDAAQLNRRALQTEANGWREVWACLATSKGGVDAELWEFGRRRILQCRAGIAFWQMGTLWS